MNKDAVISTENVSKKFCKTLKKSMLYGIVDIGRNMLGFGSQSDKLRPKEFWAVKDVSFEIKRGESFGIIGPNGSGKTTLLKMLNGIFWPDNGRISVKGRVGALIAVGAGFHPQLTGRENVYVNGAILGMTRKEINRKFDSIVDFADIGDFLDTPVSYYSSGMYIRLGFAVAVHCDPDILLIDEVLAVGDIAFQAKCFDRLAKLREKGVTTILVSHHMPKIGSFCERVLYISFGQPKALDTPEIVIDIFEKDMYKSSNTVKSSGACQGYIPIGGATIDNVHFEQKINGQVRINYGDPIAICFNYDLGDKDLNDCAFAVSVRRKSDDFGCFGIVSNFYGYKIYNNKGRVKVFIDEHNLVPGAYCIDIQIRTIKNDIPYAAYREYDVIIGYPSRYLLKNFAGVYQPNNIVWKDVN